MLTKLNKSYYSTIRETLKDFCSDKIFKLKQLMESSFLHRKKTKPKEQKHLFFFV